MKSRSNTEFGNHPIWAGPNGAEHRNSVDTFPANSFCESVFAESEAVISLSWLTDNEIVTVSEPDVLA